MADIELTWPDKSKLLLGFDKQGQPLWGAEADIPKINLRRVGHYGQPAAALDNMLIKGDNLPVLAALAGDFLGKIQCIYIDPPYNAANGTAPYQDSWDHPLWLSMMRPRLALARELLAASGLMFIHIGGEEKSYLRVTADEIFGRENFIAEISWQRAPEGRTVLGQGSSRIPCSTEFLLLYAKDAGRVRLFNNKRRVPATDKALQQYKLVLKVKCSPRLVHEELDKRGNPISIYSIDRFVLERFNLKAAKKELAKILQDYRQLLKDLPVPEQGIVHKGVAAALEENNILDNMKKAFLLENFDQVVQSVGIQKESTFQQHLLALMPGRDVLYMARYSPSRGRRSGAQVTDYYLNGRRLLFLKDYAEIIDNQVWRKVDISDFWGHEEIGVTGTAAEGGVPFRRSKKPEALLKRVIEMATSEGDWVLDCFLGSGTTAAVAHKLGRKWIGIESGEHAETICLSRLKRVVSGEDQSGISKAVDWRGGGSFGCWVSQL